MKIYKTLFLGLGLIALSSCSDFLNQTSPSELDNESTFNNAYYTELALNKVYGKTRLILTSCLSLLEPLPTVN